MSVLTTEERQVIDQWIAKFPAEQTQSAVIPALAEVQKRREGYLTTELMDAVADYLDMPKIAVYEVVSFYHAFETKPVGKFKLQVCRSISCQLAGSTDLIKYFEEKLNIKCGQTTEDKLVTLQPIECLGACRHAPVVMQGDKYHENVTPEVADRLIAQCRRSAES